MVNIAIVGATGVVGTKMIERLEESNLQVDHRTYRPVSW